VTFLRYRDTNYINILNPKDVESEVLRMALLGALRLVCESFIFLLDLLLKKIAPLCVDVINRTFRNNFSRLYNSNARREGGGGRCLIVEVLIIRDYLLNNFHRTREIV